MQQTLDFEQTIDLSFLRESLPPAKPPRRLDPVSQFILAFIGSRTLETVARVTLMRLMALFASWAALADAPVEKLEAALRDVTYPNKKAHDLKQALRMLRASKGEISFEFLEGLDDEQALFQLEQLHGVGRKIAAATLNLSTMKRRVFVVDTHVLRVLRRFGFVAPEASAHRAYDAVMAAAEGFDAEALYDLHWKIHALGGSTCTHAEARCWECPLATRCLSAKAQMPMAEAA